MDIRTMSKKDLEEAVKKLEQRFGVKVTDLAMATSGVSYIILKFSKDSLSQNEADFSIELDCICYGTHDTDGNEIATEVEMSATNGFSGAVILSADSDEQFKKYMLLAIDSKPEVLCKGGVWLE